MGCVPSSTYPDAHLRPGRPFYAAVPQAAATVGGYNSSLATVASAYLAPSGGGGDDVVNTSGGGIGAKNAQNPLQLQSAGGGVDGERADLTTTTYVTSTGKKVPFLYGRPVGFEGAEEVVACIDECGTDGNLYRLVRSALCGVCEEVEEVSHHRDERSLEEAQRCEGDPKVLAHALAEHHASQKAGAGVAAVQEQYVLALLGTDTINDSSAVRPSRRATGVSTASRAVAQEAPPNLTSFSLHASAGRSRCDDEQRRLGRANSSEDDEVFDPAPQTHYSVLPHRRKVGAAVPLALCPPTRTKRDRVPCNAGDNGDRKAMTTTPAAGAASAQTLQKWNSYIKPHRLLRLNTSETRSWAFYNDSEYIMHVLTLFDASSKLESCGSTRLWPSSIFEDGAHESPTPPPFFFGLFLSSEDDEVIPGSEFPESRSRRHSSIFGSRDMMLAEVLLPPRATRLFVEGKIRGAYRMRCTRIHLSETATIAEAAQQVAKRRDTFFQQKHRLTSSKSLQSLRSVASSAPKKAQPPPRR